MLTELLEHLHNYFVAEVHTGTFTVEEGGISPLSLADGQYYRIKGSIFNDGVHKNGDELWNETFTGEVWALAIPQAVLAIAAEIKTWCENNKESGYTSESFGGYSYSREANTSWQSVFRSRLNTWRKIC